MNVKSGTGTREIGAPRNSRATVDKINSLAASPKRLPRHDWKFTAEENPVESEIIFDFAISNTFDSTDWNW